MTLTTKAFEILATTAAKGRGVPQMPRVTLPHPLNPLPDSQIQEIVRQHTDKIVQGLTKVPQPIRA